MLIQPRNPLITLSAAPFTVLPSQQDILHDGPDEQEKHEVGEDDAVAGVVLRCVFGAVDIRRDDTVQVAPANHEA